MQKLETAGFEDGGEKLVTDKEVEYRENGNMLGGSVADGEDERPISESDVNDDVSNSKSNSNYCSKYQLLKSARIKRNARL